MRGLTFPKRALCEREESQELGTPFSHGDEIPIDPALSGPPLDPALLEEEARMRGLPVSVVVGLLPQC